MAQAKGGARGQAARRSRAVAAGNEKSEGGRATTAPICSVAFCPICMAVTAFGEARPDLVEHLLLASREMLLAIRALIDARLEGVEERPAKLERLSIE
ncbi:MAG: hypothetical protein ACRDHO_12380 [Actinomycetota bacterium]